MGKSRTPRKAKDQVTANATAATPAPREPVQVQTRRAPTPPALADLLQTLRTAVGALLDLADAAAEAITKQYNLRKE